MSVPTDAPPPATLEPAEVTEPLIYSIGRIFARPWADQWFDLKAYGINNVPQRGGVLIVSNHQSYLDPILVAVKLKRPLSFLAKSELFKNPFFGAFIGSFNAFPVRQGEGDVGAVKETIRRLQEGHALNMYPEGTRSPNGEIMKMQAGIGLIAKRAGVPVVPAVIEGSFQAWPPKRGQIMFRPHPVRIVYGPPMDLRNLKASQIVERIGTTLHTMFNDLRQRERERNHARR
ncbi:MAG: 1-acyl-sn-glycerol-3-phosphate acyltransferase [Phycisphaerales bacterium]|jgi:1-acyl-sn-glycerol-3-phosphate acyltransferase|nr:1-acyl-sn-glycerol-3-phosphate acyltransferase [Phycisphaerales bacterium]